MSTQPKVAIVGGGLAGLAAAAILAERDFHVELFEARRFLGGRAGSFIDPTTGELIDHCQHVAMGCCTAFLDFCRRTGVDHLFRRDDVLHFYSPEGTRRDVRAARWLPAPLHLGPSLLKLSYLSMRERLSIARTLLALARWGRDAAAPPQDEPIGRWLRQRGQSQRAIDRFWSVVLVSALGESVDRASVAAARKVFVDGFLAHRRAHHVYVPQAPLGEIYEQGIACWLQRHGARIHVGSRVDRVAVEGNSVANLSQGPDSRRFDDYVVAVAWPALPRLFDAEALRSLHLAPDSIAGSPITSIHLWFDRPITQLRHAVLVDRLTQWVFRHHAVENDAKPERGESQISDAEALAGPDAATRVPNGSVGASPSPHYYQVVISASDDLEKRTKKSIIAEVLADLRAVFPDASLANLLHHRIVTQPGAVFSYRPGLDDVRPAQQTPIGDLFLAGDWTATGWPSTMESAVRSGYLAAQAILKKHGRSDANVLPPELPRGWLARRLF